MLFLNSAVQLFKNPLTCGVSGEELRRSRQDEPIRVLDCVVPDGEIPGYICIEDSKTRLQWHYENVLDLVQVGHPPDVGFALVPRKMITDVPF